MTGPVSLPEGRVLVCGDVINDVVVKPLDATTPDSDTLAQIRACPGGSAANQAAWMACYGVPVTFVGRVGAADHAYHTEALARAGVDARLVADAEAATGTIVVLVAADGGRTMFVDRGANLRLRRDDLPDAVLDGVRLLHLTGYSFFEPGVRAVALELIDAARSRGIPFTIDPSSSGFLARLGSGEFVAWTSGAAASFPNRDEAALLTGEQDPVTMVLRLREHYGVVALKLGADGVVVADADHAPTAVAAVTSTAVDTTGAGDAFCGAFISGWLRTADVVEAAALGVQACARAVADLGGRPLVGEPQLPKTPEQQGSS